MEQSQAWRMNSADVQKWMKNLFVFLAPLAVIYLTNVIGNINGGFALQMFRVDAITQGALVLYVLNGALDFFKKLSTGQ